MPASAPRIDPRLVAAVARLDDPRQPIAETNRRIGRLAESLGIPRPSYQQVRLLVHAERDRQRRRRAVLELLLEVDVRARPPEALLELIHPLLDEDAGLVDEPQP